MTASSGGATEGGPTAATSARASIRVQRRIEWSDTDASGAYHNSAVFAFMEAAEAALLERLGLVEEIYGRHPRVRIEADFLRPLWFRDLVDVTLSVAEVGRTSVAYDVEMARAGDPCVRGRLVAVLLDRIGGTPVPWSDEHRRMLLGSGPQAPELLVTG